MNRRTNLLAGTVIVALLMVFVLMLMTQLKSEAAIEATFIVKSTGDTGGATCSSGNCTLRQAINAANLTLEEDTITFQLDPDSTITLTLGELPTIQNPLIIDGSTAVNLTVSGANTSTIFVNASYSTTIKGLTIRDGNADGSSGGGIYNFETLLLQDSRVISNTADFGGGIASEGSLIVEGSTISDNIAGTNNGGGIGIFNDASLTLTHSTIAGNSAAYDGGGIQTGSNARVDVKFSTISGNWTENRDGGGISINNGSELSVSNSTIYSNTAFEDGGGLFIKDSSVATINNSTLSHNAAGNGGGIYVASTLPTLHLSNTIVANSRSGGDCDADPSTIDTNDNNLIEDDSCDPDFNGDPKMGPLQDNGGETETMMIYLGSPAIDQGDGATCEPVDQRSVARPIDGDGDGTATCDIGAVEAPDPVFVVNSVADTDDSVCDASDCTLREAMNKAITGGLNYIHFDLPADSTITLGGTQLPVISDPLIIDGSTADNLTVSGANASRIFQIGSSGEATIIGMSIRDGDAGAEAGGGVNSLGILLIQDSQVISNTGTGGGGISSAGSLTIERTVIRDNVASSTNGGGVLISSGGSVTITHSTLSGNWAFDYGGGLDLDPSTQATVKFSTISNNTAENINGGGIEASTSAHLTLVNSTLFGNAADQEGGGISLEDGAGATINNSTISDNQATTGGGFFADGSNPKLEFTNTIIANSQSGGDCSASPGRFGTKSNNLIEDDSCNPDFHDDPALGPLQNNGGDTMTMLPSAGSQAIDNGENAFCEPADQRGVSRPQDGDGDGVFDCDIGSVEVVATTFTVNKTADTDDGTCTQADCTLREAINASNATDGANVIRFNLSAGSVITLTGELPVITDTVKVDGSTALSLTVSGNSAYRVFEIGSGTTVTMTTLTIANGDADTTSTCPDDCGAGILNGGQLVLGYLIFSNNNAWRGGGLYNSSGATLTVVMSEFAANTANYGAGIYDASGGQTLLGKSNFIGNQATNLGGGLFVPAGPGKVNIELNHYIENTAEWGGGIFNDSEMSITGSEFMSNTATSGGGGGIYNAGPAVISGNNMVGNSAPEGGALYNKSVTTTSFSGNTLAGNSALAGAAIYNATSGTMSISSNTFTDNMATNYGGGIYNHFFGSITSLNNKLTGNEAGSRGGGFFSEGRFSSTLDVISGSTTADGGGGIHIGGSGVLTMTKATLEHNNSDGGGGGLANWGLATILESSVYSNTAKDGGGIFNGFGDTLILGDNRLDSNKATGNGGGLYNWGQVSIDDDTVVDNSADFSGGGIYNLDELIAVKALIIGNSSKSLGGGIYISSNGQVDFVDSTVQSNHSDGSGGGFYNTGDLAIIRNTLYGNSAINNGGGINNNPTGQLTLTNSTLSNNSAGWGGGLFNDGQSTVNNSTLSGNLAGTDGGGLMNNNGDLYLSNTIIANSLGGGSDCRNEGTITDNIHNLVKDGSCNPDFSGDPLLEPLANNGGETWTKAIGVGSPAFNAGDNATCEATDQRGVSRPQGKVCDIGSYEYKSDTATDVYLPFVIKS